MSYHVCPCWKFSPIARDKETEEFMFSFVNKTFFGVPVVPPVETATTGVSGTN